MAIEDYFLEYGIKPEKRNPDDETTTVGFSESQQKWYGFAHVCRLTGFCVIQGFGVGDSVKKSDTKFFAHAYIPATPEELVEQYVHFFRSVDDTPEEVAQRRACCEILPDRSGIRIHPEPLVIEVVRSPEALQEFIEQSDAPLPVELYSTGSYIVKCGRGEWTAQTLDDAYLMACDFAENVNSL